MLQEMILNIRFFRNIEEHFDLWTHSHVFSLNRRRENVRHVYIMYLLTSVSTILYVYAIELE